MATNKNSLILHEEYHFPSAVYSISKPEFLDAAKLVSEEYLNHRKQNGPELNRLYPVFMTENFGTDKRLLKMLEFTAGTGYNILTSQGHDMRPLEVTVDSFWAQEHYEHSANDEHIHAMGAQLTGFYFLECPENCSMVLLHDPRPGRKQIALPDADMSKVSFASNTIAFLPVEGQFMFTNSWLPHAFGRHGSDKPFKFIHFTLGVRVAQNQVEVV